MPIKIITLIRNASQCLSIPPNAELIDIDQHWSALIDIGINARILIGIDRHWALIGTVLSIYACTSILELCHTYQTERHRNTMSYKYGNKKWVTNSKDAPINDFLC